MLNCVYHPLDDMRVVECDERKKLLDTGVWFDSPAEAAKLKANLEREMLDKPKRKRKKDMENDDE